MFEYRYCKLTKSHFLLPFIPSLIKKGFVCSLHSQYMRTVCHLVKSSHACLNISDNEPQDFYSFIAMVSVVCSQLPHSLMQCLTPGHSSTLWGPQYQEGQGQNSSKFNLNYRKNVCRRQETILSPSIY